MKPASRSPSRRVPQAESGFTLMEMIVVVAVIGILVLITVPSFLGMLNRFKLTGTTREVAALMQAARLESIKMSRTAQVNYDATSNTFFSFVDLDGDGTFSDGDKLLAGRVIIPRKVDFWGPGDGGPLGANAIEGWDDAPVHGGPIYSSDGSVDRAGAFRFRDASGNFLEVRVEVPATGRIVLRKWFEADSAFFLNGESGHKWTWK
ncbi:MAG: prepilin-type N-terminal cleavage/methylation domain-containing protein [Thermoanaerobaculia bacterium]